MDKPLLSVVAICYNHERFVVECLDSIRAQTFRDFEFIVVDDASTDGSVERIRQWLRDTGMPCRLVVHDRNRGLCATLNEVLSLVNGKYLAKVATDDTWYPDKLERQLAAMESLPDGVAVLYGDARIVDEGGRIRKESFLEAHGQSKPPPRGRILESLIVRNFIPSMTTLLKTQALRDVGGYDERLVYEDWDMWLRVAMKYEFEFMDQVVANYREVGNSMVRTTASYGSPNRLWADTVILEKCVRSGALSREQIASARRRMWRMAYGLLRVYRDPRGLDALARAVASVVTARHA